MGEQFDLLRAAVACVEEPIGALRPKFPYIDRRADRASVRQASAHQLASRHLSSCRARLRAPQMPMANQQKDEFLAVFSHEMRSSLGAIRNAAHLLGLQSLETPVGEKARQLIERQVGRMTRLADDLIDVARIRSETQHLRCERIDLRVVLKHAMETVESDIDARNHRLAASLPDAPVWLRGDPGRLEQVFVNLLVNAAKYTDRGGDLSLSMQHNDGHVIVRICDSGIGIAADVLPRVFDLFMQADSSSRRAAAGFGIGLALVRSLVELHRGSVSATSAGLGQGSQFVVRLPAL
jgi:signal transduction histidine kinase